MTTIWILVNCNTSAEAEREIKRLHGDQVPFVGYAEVRSPNPEYVRWMRGELACLTFSGLSEYNASTV